jgi:hypothetical protein
MRVLICDQETEMLETVARSFDVDIATSKATCVDLMRANQFDVLVASERLSDGSGLELLSHVAARWPDTLRVLVIEPQRLKLLRGKLGPFRLHATMRYPIDEDELEAVLERMQALLASPTRRVLRHRRPNAACEPARRRPPDRLAFKTCRSQPLAHTSSLAAPKPKPAPAVARPAARSPARPSASNLARPTRSTAAPPPGKPVDRTVRRKLGNYTPLGAPEDDEPLRIVEREFDQTVAPLAARAIRTREEASRPKTPGEKLTLLAAHMRKTVCRLLKR